MRAHSSYEQKRIITVLMLCSLYLLPALLYWYLLETIPETIFSGPYSPGDHWIIGERLAATMNLLNIVVPLSMSFLSIRAIRGRLSATRFAVIVALASVNAFANWTVYMYLSINYPV